MSKKILIVATSHDKMGDTDKPTGCWAEEIMAPIVMFTEKGYKTTVASMKGGKVPIDPGSLTDDYVTDKVKQFQAESGSATPLDTTVAVDKVSADEYDAIFIPGGHGVMWDMPESAALQKLVAQFADGGKIVSSVCHGPAALVNVKLADGSLFVKGKKITCFSDEEEKAVSTLDVVPWTPEQKMKELGAEYSNKDAWTPYTVVDGKLITGQNPQSSEAVASKVIEALG